MHRKIMNVFGWVIFIAILFFAYWMVQLQNTKDISKGTPVEISFLELTEDSDCILIQQGKTNVLIDTGTQQDEQKIMDYLKEKDVTDIEYLILTHPDKDHIGGALGILDNFKVKNIIEPYYPKANKNLNALNEKAKLEDIRIIYPMLTREFSVGEMKILVYPPLEKHYEKDNNYSLTTLVKHGKVNMLFTGDAEKKRLEELMLVDWNNIQLCKIPHHGRSNTNSEQFIRAISPTYAVITGADADEIIKKTCEDIKTQVFYTGTGNINFYSNGDMISDTP